MRLKLSVHRQALPPVHVLWDAEALRPNHVASGAITTIAQLLEQINDVIPLEAEEWGLEDYAVEVNGFECLHFCSLNIFKEDDQVTVRPLQTADIRYRRVSGRHQITADGKHLIDGVAFGRPFLRRSERPAIRIPPRKGIRLAHDDDEDIETTSIIYNTEQALITQELDDSEDDGSYDGGENEESGDEVVKLVAGGVEDDADYGLDGDLEEDLSVDVRHVADKMHKFQKDFGGTERPALLNGSKKTVGRVTRSRRRMLVSGLGLQGAEAQELLEGTERQLQGGYHNPLLDQYYHDEPNQPSTTIRKRKRALNARSSLSSGRNRKRTNLEDSRRSSSASMKSVHFEGDNIETPATILEIHDTDSEDDKDYQPDAGQVSASLESNKENVFPGTDSIADSVGLALSSSVTSDTESDSSNTSSSSSSSSGGSSSSEDINESQQQNANNQSKPKSGDSNKGFSVNQSGDQVEKLTFTPPGQGQSKTHKRNERRRVRNKLMYLKKIGVLSSTATLEDYKHYIEDRNATRVLQHGQNETLEPEMSEVLEAKKKFLLEAIASGGIDVGQASQKNEENTANRQDSEIYPLLKPDIFNNDGVVPLDFSFQASSAEAEVLSTHEVASAAQDQDIASSKSSKQRSRLDLASSRRLLFGSLGLRAPKTKADEDRLREKILENVKPLHQVNSAQGPETTGVETGPSDDINGKWQDRINLMAVECCYEGMELSTPPFPFVQRWDPQQKWPSGVRLGGQSANRGKKQKRNQKQFYQGEDADGQSFYAPDIEHGVSLPTSKRFESQEAQSPLASIHQTGSDDYQTAVDKQLMQDSTEPAAVSEPASNDLPDLPEDIATYAPLIRALASPGAIIAFRQLEMSQDTNWQPKVSEYRTALINEILDDDCFLVVLAQRNRPQKERLYDRETGERVYSKFEMPEYENEDATETDDVAIEISLAEMIEPKLIKIGETRSQAPTSLQHEKFEIEVIDMSGLADDDSQHSSDGELERIEGTPNITKTFIGPEVLVTDLAEELPVRTREDNTRDERLEVNEETRQEISLIIKDAGFRSNVHSDLERRLDERLAEYKAPTNGEETRKVIGDVESPKFHGFSSSPPAEESSKPSLEETDETVQLGPKRTSPTNIINMESFQPDEHTETNAALSDIFDPEWQPQRDENESPAHPVPPQYSSTNKRKAKFARKDSCSVTSSSPSSKITKRKLKSTNDRDLMARTKAISTSLDGVDSDDDLPTIEHIFSTARSMLEDAIPDSDSDSDGSEHEPTRNPMDGKLTKFPLATSSKFSRGDVPAFSVDDVLSSSSSSFVDSGEVPDPILPRIASQPPPESQIVDLTYSSDPVEPDGSEYEDRNGAKGMPRGPGWVQKTRSAGRGAKVRVKAKRRQTRSIF